MGNFAGKVLWIYIVLLLIGGLMGFFKAKSKASLIASTIFAVVLIFAAIPGILDYSLRGKIINIVMALLLVVFAIRLAKTKKFMPNGLMLAITIAALALWNLFR